MTKKSNIYTRTGDKGKTSLIGNSRVPKYDLRIEAYGSIDELKSFLGLIRDLSEDEGLKTELFDILNILFVCESRIAAESEEFLKMMPSFHPEWIDFLENRIDSMDNSLPPLKSFILPTGYLLSSYIHVARTICRRVERTVLLCDQSYSIESDIIKYINRLSDYLFVLARYVSHNNNVPDSVWNSKDK